MANRKPDVPYRAPDPGQASRLCSGTCGLVWARIDMVDTYKCKNCHRAYSRERYENGLARPFATDYVDVEILRAQGFTCAVCLDRLPEPPPTSAVGPVRPMSAVVSGVALCLRCASAAWFLDNDAARTRRLYSVFVEDASVPIIEVTTSSGECVSVRDWKRLLNLAADDPEVAAQIDGLVQRVISVNRNRDQ